MTRLSVRELVEFTYHGENLSRGASPRDMQEGMLSHRARQAALQDGWEAEVMLSMECVYLDGQTLTLSGRMDGFLDGEFPEIEEIKLYTGETPPREPMPAHDAQAVVYAYMLCALRGIKAVTVSVCYVNRSGECLARFTRTLSALACTEVFIDLYRRYLAWQKTLAAHRTCRDATLCDLRFPYDTYRKGQREMAAAVYGAIRRGERVLCEMPTGTGKSAAAIFPALMAMGQGMTQQVFYLTARTTQRKAALECLRLFRVRPLSLWTLTLTAREKQCPRQAACDTESCPYAIGFFIRLPDAIQAILPLEDWNERVIADTAARHRVCPFEFSLTLCEIADVVIADYNYAFDPMVRIKRVFETRRDMTLLADESHNLAPRVRDMLSACLDTAALRALRLPLKKRSHPLYKRLSRAIRFILQMEEASAADIAGGELPDILAELKEALLDAIGNGAATDAHFDALMAIKLFLDSLTGECHAYLLQGGQRSKRLTALCLDASHHIRAVTKGLRGTAFFSATLSPLDDMKTLLGAEETDKAYRIPSPFPPEQFFVKRVSVDTRYGARERTAGRVAEAIRALFMAKPGKYIAFFPSFAYLNLVAGLLGDLPLALQERGMDEAARDAYLDRFLSGDGTLLGMCVLGGIFAEGVDLPGDCLSGAALVGVGLPQVNPYQEALREYSETRFGDGFHFAYRIPGMHKILQAAGRVIRSETDKGAALLIDARYEENAYARLCPSHWMMREGSLAEALEAFWQA